MKFIHFLKRAAVIMMAAFFLASCSSTASKNANDVLNNYDDTDYRTTETKLAPNLEVPPNLLAPRAAPDGFAQALKEEKADEPKQTIPTYKAQNIKVESNFSERWLVIKSLSSDQVWKGVTAFLTSSGFKIKESRKDIGLIKTDFTPRKEIVPPDAMSSITRVLNSWRPELATGGYDRVTARIVYDADKNETRVYFYNTTIYDATSINDNDSITVEDATGWRIRHYSPLAEAVTLYQALIFFGTSQEDALKQIQSVEQQRQLVGGDSEFEGVLFNADKDTVWNYLIAMVYRSGWQIDHMKPKSYALWVKIPEGLKKDKSFMSKLAFWKSDGVAKPVVVKLSLSDVKDAKTTQSLLRVQALESATPLNADQQKAIVQSMGLLTK
ncbi:outer membrane protein assembly factor BamC [Hydrogenovibrio kuenenii]|uniref:outer membrane protein assembly factor BamC n=1 Tax=Hydrogenovibrio kuenenii TaxID=63658 RepID=UPI00046538B4|nr:outer membrane protein assembly factor BamC [Hydrogenovibrio kuenenii]